MTDPNGASVHSQTIPAGYQAKEGDFYTFGIWNLTKFNARYNTTIMRVLIRRLVLPPILRLN